VDKFGCEEHAKALEPNLTGVNMQKAIAIVILAAALAGCDAVNTMTEGFKHAKAVEADIAEATGVKPGVGFSWNNGQLTSVTVSFPKLYEDKPLRELAALSRAAVAKEFKQTPKAILLSFAIDPATTAEAGTPRRELADLDRAGAR
jgi:hypothetical protein